MQKSVSHSLFVSLLAASLFLAGAARATLAPYDGIGGNGGVPFRLDCGEYGILVGLIGHSGVVSDQVGGLCVKIDPVSGTWIGGVYETPRASGTKPEFTPNLQYSWELVNETATHPSSFGGLPLPTRVQNPCIYVVPPCASSWTTNT